MHDFENSGNMLWNCYEQTLKRKFSHYVITSFFMSLPLFSNEVAVTTEHTSYKPVSVVTAAGLVLKKKRHLKEKTTLSSSASRSNLGFWLDEQHACGAWVGLQMSTVHSLFFFLYYQFLNQQLEETQLLIWVEAAASVALVEVLIVVYWTSCSLNPWVLSCIVIFCCRRVGNNQISVSRDQRESICVHLHQE